VVLPEPPLVQLEKPTWPQPLFNRAKCCVEPQAKSQKGEELVVHSVYGERGLKKELGFSKYSRVMESRSLCYPCSSTMWGHHFLGHPRP
jgi:hypothetical protein